jgi:hypothetical protein
MNETEMVRSIVTEMRAAELAAALRHAVAGDAHWRLEAKTLLAEINDCVLPPRYSEALREVDTRKRAAEIMDDLVDG